MLKEIESERKNRLSVEKKLAEANLLLDKMKGEAKLFLEDERGEADFFRPAQVAESSGEERAGYRRLQ
jgi:hypothetical protein